MTELIQDTVLWDVVEVSRKTGKVVGFMGEGKTYPNASAIVSMAVMRRGTKKSFYIEVRAGSKVVGELFRPIRNESGVAVNA